MIVAHSGNKAPQLTFNFLFIRNENIETSTMLISIELRVVIVIEQIWLISQLKSC